MRRARASASHRSLSGTALLVLLAQVVASLLQRPELRPILSALGWSDSQRRRGSDDAVVTSIRDFLKTHLHSDGTRFSEQQAAFNVLVQAAAGPLVKSERHIAAAAEALGVRYATFRELLEVRAKMDAEAAHEVKVGRTLLLVSRKKRCDAADDEAALFQEWSHDPEVCRYDSNQRTGGKRVHRFDAEAGSDGLTRFEVHEKRTLPCSRKVPRPSPCPIPAPPAARPPRDLTGLLSPRPRLRRSSVSASSSRPSTRPSWRAPGTSG